MKTTAKKTATPTAPVDYYELGRAAIGSVVDHQTGRAVRVRWDEAYEYMRHDDNDQELFPDSARISREDCAAFRRGYAGKARA
jgi:hypothetical protein